MHRRDAQWLVWRQIKSLLPGCVQRRAWQTLAKLNWVTSKSCLKLWTVGSRKGTGRNVPCHDQVKNQEERRVPAMVWDHFIDAVADTRWKVYLFRPKNLSDALMIVVELEAFIFTDQHTGRTARAARASPESLVEQNFCRDFRRELQEMKDLLMNLATQKSGGLRRPEGCWSCGDKNHLARSCPNKQQQPSGNGQQPSSRVWSWLLLPPRGPYNLCWRLVRQKTVRAGSSFKDLWRVCLSPS